MMKISSQLLLFILLSCGIGFAMTIQTAINTQLREQLNAPLQAALLSFFVGTIVLVVLVILQPVPKPSLTQLMGLPWYLWMGGFLGVYAISISIFTAPQLGFLTFSGLVIFGQIVMSMVLDHFGWLGVEKTPLHWQRIVGAMIIFTGVMLTLQH